MNKTLRDLEFEISKTKSDFTVPNNISEKRQKKTVISNRFPVENKKFHLSGRKTSQ